MAPVLGLWLLVWLRADEAPPRNQLVAVTEKYDLARCLQTALEHNPEILQAKERIERQRGVVVTARSSSVPHLQLKTNLEEMDQNRVETFAGLRFGSVTHWDINLELSQAVYTGGRNEAAVSREKKGLDAALLDLQRVIRDTLLGVRERYFSTLLALSRAAEAEESVRSDFALAILDLEKEHLNVDTEVRRIHSSFLEASELIKASGWPKRAWMWES